MLVFRLAQQVYGHVADGGHVLRSGDGSQSAEIFMEHHVENPVQTVLDMPMAPHGVGEQFFSGEYHQRRFAKLLKSDDEIG